MDGHVHLLADDRIERVANRAREGTKGEMGAAIARRGDDGDATQAELHELRVDTRFELRRAEHACLVLRLELPARGVDGVHGGKRIRMRGS